MKSPKIPPKSVFDPWRLLWSAEHSCSESNFWWSWMILTNKVGASIGWLRGKSGIWRSSRTGSMTRRRTSLRATGSHSCSRSTYSKITVVRWEHKTLNVSILLLLTFRFGRFQHRIGIFGSLETADAFLKEASPFHRRACSGFSWTFAARRLAGRSCGMTSWRCSLPGTRPPPLCSPGPSTSFSTRPLGRKKGVNVLVCTKYIKISLLIITKTIGKH